MIKSIDLILKSIGAAATGAAAAGAAATGAAAAGAEPLNPSRVDLVSASNLDALSNSAIIKSTIATPSSFALFAPINAFLAVPLTSLSLIKSIDLILKSIGAAATGAAAAGAAATGAAAAGAAAAGTAPSLISIPSNFSALVNFCSLCFLFSK